MLVSGLAHLHAWQPWLIEVSTCGPFLHGSAHDNVCMLEQLVVLQMGTHLRAKRKREELSALSRRAKK